MNNTVVVERRQGWGDASRSSDSFFDRCGCLLFRVASAANLFRNKTLHRRKSHLLIGNDSVDAGIERPIVTGARSIVGRQFAYKKFGTEDYPRELCAESWVAIKPERS